MPAFTLFSSNLMFIVLNYYCKLPQILFGTRNEEILNLRQCLGQLLVHAKNSRYLLSE